MARPAKSVKTKTGTMTKEEEEKRLEIEDKLRGNNDKLLPPLYLSEEQKIIFFYIMEELKQANILGNLDLFILSQTSIAIDRIQKLDRIANENQEIVFENSFRQARAEASKEYFRCCNELCLSPQSRAKISVAKFEPGEKKKTIMDILNEED